MKKRNLRYFILLMAFALVGLTALQFYWVNVALEANRERFEQNVHEALNEVAHKLEQKEVLYVTQKSIDQVPIDDIVGIFVDTLENEPPKTSAQTTHYQKDPLKKVSPSSPNSPRASMPPTHDKNILFAMRFNDSLAPERPNPIRISAENPSKDTLPKPFPSPLKRESAVRIYTSDSSHAPYFAPSNAAAHQKWKAQLGENPDSVYVYSEQELNQLSSRFDLRLDLSARRDRPSLYSTYAGRMIEQRSHSRHGGRLVPPKEVVRISNKLDVVHFIMEELQNRDQNLRQRINPKVLNSLLKRELEDRGINIDYQFLVESRLKRQKPQFLFCSSPHEQENILRAGFSVNLFPTDIFGSEHILHAYFPDQEAFIFKRMWWVFGTSLLFIGLVVFCFVKAVSTIIKQKKMSEITNDFINNMTHELKTPISTVSLACEAIQDPDVRQLPKQVDRYLNIIKEENVRLGSQVEKVLQIAVLDKGDFKLKISTVNIHEVIHQAIRNIIIQIENRGGHLEKHLDADYPAIEGDEVHITNMIHNLLDNANKYSPDAPQISIQTQSLKEGIQISVSDQGQGMSRETKDKVFDKFYRVPTGNVHNVKGFGLGLSYVKTMVEAHQGEVKVKSELNKGSTFTLFLPYRQDVDH